MTTITLPALGESITHVTISAILVKVGDAVSADQPLVEVETDKAAAEVPAPSAGTVTAILVAVGDQVAVGAPLVQLEAGGAPPAPAARPNTPPAQATAPAAPAPAAATPVAPAQTPATSEAQHKLLPAAPSVRRLARELGVALEQVHGSGPGGRISAEDVQLAASGRTAPTPAKVDVTLPSVPDTRREPMSAVRKAIARNLGQAWATIPHVTNHDLIDITELDAARRRLPAESKVTVTAVLLKALALALRQFPQMNASLDLERGEILYHQRYHLGVAVDTERGLLVPVVRDADRKTVPELAAELRLLSEKARGKKLLPDEMRGATFTITNLGGIGGTGFTPIINPPEVAILGVSASRMQPVWREGAGGGEGSFVPRLLMPVSLSYDHRLIDGADAARFLRLLARILEEPYYVLMGL